MDAMAGIRKQNVYRVGNRLGYERTHDSTFVGYFEFGNYDGQACVYWAWARTAQQDSIANHWLCSELGMKEARL